jgi:hypothetical protein
MPIVSINQAKKAQIDRNTDLENLDFWFSNVVEAGWASPEGWRLGLSEADVTLLTGQFVLAKEADAAGGDLPAVIDKAGEPHVFESLEELTALMLAYGQARAALSAEYASRKAAILAQ